MVARHDVIKYRQTEALLRFEKPIQIESSIARKLKEKFSLMAAMRDMPDMTRKKMAIGARHRLLFLRAPIFEVEMDL